MRIKDDHAERLQRAGWTRILRAMVSTSGTSDDLVRWRDPSGAVFTEAEAIKRLDQTAGSEEGHDG